MKNVEYPRVRPPTSLMPPKLPSDNRFSWMDPPGGAEHRDGTRRQTQIQPPPPPQPEHEVAQAYMPGQAMDSQTHDAGVPQYEVRNPVVTQEQQHPQAYSGYPVLQYATQRHAQHPPQTQASQNPNPLIPQPPDPSKQQAGARDIDTKAHLGPDVNPLTPTTPKQPHRASTNMAIVPPSSIEPGQFSASTFTPSPQSIKGGSWQHSLCSCGEPSICMTALFCPCVVYGKTQYRLGLREERKDPTNMLGYTAVNGACMAFAILCGINSILSTIQHTRVRKTYNMSTEAGNVAGDCLKSMCCCCCVVAQAEKEVKFREEQARKPASAVGRKEGYVAPTSMSFSPPPR